MPFPAPTGLGLYLRALAKSPPPAVLAKQLAGAGIRWVAIGGPWHDTKGRRFINKPADVARYADAFAALSVTPHVWGYPWWTTVPQFVADMTACTTPAIAGWLLDPEVSFKNRPAPASALLAATRAAFTTGPIGMSSYGRIATMKPFPWDAFTSADYGSPQLYLEASPGVRKGLEEWQSRGYAPIVPSFGLFTKTATGVRRRTPAELQDHLASFVDAAVPVHGLIGWAHNFLTPPLLDVLSRWSDWTDRGVLAVPG